MKRTTIIIAFLLALTAGAANAADNLAQYYNYVHQAEAAVITEHFSKAALYYDTAFMHKASPFAVDIYNACICQAKVHNMNSVLDLSKKLVIKGAEKFFFDKSIFREFKQSPQWALLNKGYDSLKQIRPSNAHQALIEKIKEFHKRDQAIHCMLPKNSGDVAFIQKMNRINDSLSLSLKDLMTDNDYLGEDVIGANFLDTALRADPLYGVLVLHEFQKSGSQLRAAVDQAIFSGKLKSELGLSWIENSGVSKLRFARDFFMQKDTLWSLYDYNKDTSSASFRIISSMIDRLIFPKRSPRADSICRKYYVDAPDKVLNKIIYNFHDIKKNPEAWPLFIILPYPDPGGYSDNEAIKRSFFISE